MRKHSLFVVVILSCLLLFPDMAQTDNSGTENGRPLEITILITPDVYKDYRVFMYGRTPKCITNYSGPMSRRDIVELVLFQQALVAGGLDAHIQFKTAPTYLRISREIQVGSVAAAGNALWLSDLKKLRKDILISDAIIEDGNFEAGLYASPDNSKAMFANSLEKVQALTVVCNRNWTPDWLALEKLDLHEMHHIQIWTTMVRMVSHKRADFLLAPFQPTKGMLLRVDDTILAPIHGVKVNLQGSRHFAVSKHHPHGEKVFEALQKGLTMLKKKGIIDKAYRQCGFFNEKVRDWKCLN